MVRLVFVTAFLAVLAAEARVSKNIPNSLTIEVSFEPVVKAKAKKESGEAYTPLFDIVARIKNISSTTQIFCEEPVLSTLNWQLLKPDGQAIANASRGRDVDYNYSPRLNESRCHILKPGEALRIPDSVRIEKSEKGYRLNASFLSSFGPVPAGEYKIFVQGQNRAASPSFPEEKDLVHKMIKKSGAVEPQASVSATIKIDMPPKN